uniref:(northern house mosquito) hypothetical protein n=1 Tax=Culex pipiens TaxID=7175 RepID=A0A8D8I2D2_CULPI
MYRSNSVSAKGQHRQCSSIRRSDLKMESCQREPTFRVRGSSNRAESRRVLLSCPLALPPTPLKQKGHLCFHAAFSVSLDRIRVFFQNDTVGLRWKARFETATTC